MQHRKYLINNDIELQSHLVNGEKRKNRHLNNSLSESRQHDGT